MALTLDEANRIVRGAIAKAQELNIRISAAVCDSGGRLIALQRMDNAIWASAYGSQGKAVASAAFGRPSGELTERASSRALAASAAGHRSRTKTAPALASPNCSVHTLIGLLRGTILKSHPPKTSSEDIAATT